MQYQIKRCSAPCCGYISVEDYAGDVELARLFLSGKNAQTIDLLTQRMDAASQKKAYEEAAQYRDQIANLRSLQESQHVMGQAGDVDVVVALSEHGHVCVELLSIRHGSVLGSQSFYPKVPDGETTQTILSAFLSQYYLHAAQEQSLPDEIIINEAIEETDCLSAVLSQLQHKTIRVTANVRAERARWRALALTNAKHALANILADKNHFQQRLQALTDVLQLAQVPDRIECFDISHTQGAQTVGSCVVFDSYGARKSDYRRFNIAGITKGDDYAAMHQALERRYTKVQQTHGQLPDILIIDGGKGQLTQARAVLEALQVTSITLLGVAKGGNAKAWI